MWDFFNCLIFFKFVFRVQQHSHYEEKWLKSLFFFSFLLHAFTNADDMSLLQETYHHVVVEGIQYMSYSSCKNSKLKS